jgi:hypothetical protein
MQANDVKPLSAEEVQTRVRVMLTDMEKFEQELRIRRQKATEYFLGKPFGNEEPGRSQIVITAFRDTVLSMYPAMNRIMFNSAERSVEIIPQRPGQEEEADRISEYLNHIYLRENNGLLVSNAVREDAYVRRLGVAKVWWDEAVRTETTAYSSLTQEEIEALAAQPDTELQGIEVDDSVLVQDAEGNSVPVFKCEAKRTIREGRIRVEALPREEFLYTRRARNLKDALCVAHSTFITVAEARQIGYPENAIQEALDSELAEDQLERLVRDPDNLPNDADAAATGENTLLKHVELYPYMDVDGDGVAELRKICTLGSGFNVVYNEPWDERPFAYLTPYPLAHRVEGLDVGDLTMDLQLLESNISRSILDSLALSINPRTEIVEGQVEMKDVLNTEIGAIIRAKQPGMVREVSHRFVGADALPLLEWIAQKKEERTGRARGPDGLDQSALQSSTPSAVNAAVTASQERLQLLARVEAEMFMKPLMLLMYKLAKRHQSKRMFRFRNRFVEIDPQTWDESPEIVVNVALGDGQVQQKLEVLTGIKQTQEQYIQMFGPDNPLVGFAELRATIDRAARLAGEHHIDRMFRPIDPNNPPQLPQPGPTPEQQAMQAQMQIESAKLQLEQMKEQAKQQIEAARLAHEQRMAEVSAQLDQIKLEIQQARAEMATQVRSRQVELTHEREVARMNLEATLRREEMLLKYGSEAAKQQAEVEARVNEVVTEQETRVHEAEVEQETRVHEAEADHEAKVVAAAIQADAKERIAEKQQNTASEAE